MAPETRKTTMDSLEDQIRALTQQMEALIRRQDDQNQINHNQNQLLNKRLDEQSRKHDEIIKQLQKSLDEPAVERSQHTPQPLQQIPTETRIPAETGNNCVLKPLSFSPKIECPKFDGTNPRNWIDKCGRYFELCKVLEYQKVDIASLYMIGKAEDWMCSYMSNRRGVCWNEFVDDLFGRFRDESGTEVVEQFNKLCQSGDLDAYVDEFEHYKSVMKQHNHVLPDAYLLDSFIGGLQPAVRPFVRAFKPVSITQAIRYARLQEETLLVSKNTKMFPLTFKPALSNLKPPILPTPELFDRSPKKVKLWQQYTHNGMQGQVGEGEAVYLTLEVLNAISLEERKRALRRLRLNVLIFDPGGLSLVSEMVQVETMAFGAIFILFALRLDLSTAKLRVVQVVAVMGGLFQIFIFMCLCGISVSLCSGKPSKGAFVGEILSMSFTTVILKFLMEKNRVNALHGQVIVGTLNNELLYQLVVVAGRIIGWIEFVEAVMARFRNDSWASQCERTRTRDNLLGKFELSSISYATQITMCLDIDAAGILNVFEEVKNSLENYAYNMKMEAMNVSKITVLVFDPGGKPVSVILKHLGF